jgi:drug/metabolite transporter (DMT)-like permease
VSTSCVACGVALALGSALAWSVLDVVRKRAASQLSAPAIVLGITAPQVPIHVALALGTGLPDIRSGFVPLTLLAAATTVAANLLFVRAVRISPLSATVPYLSFTPVATLGAGLVLLGQTPDRWGVAGVATVAAGALVLGGTDRELLRHPWRALAREPGSRLMLGVAGLFAVTNAVDRMAILRASEPVYAALLTGSVSAALVTSRSLRTELASRRRRLGLLAAGGVAGAAALLLQFTAYRFLYVAYVDAVKRGGGNLLAVALGVLVFAEGDVVRRLVAASLMSAGVALVLLSS